MAVYINGDVAWDSGCARPGRLLGRRDGYLSAWADLAVLTGAPVLPIFCSHRPGGRFALTIDPPIRPAPGEPAGGRRRATSPGSNRRSPPSPAEAMAHLLWPSFGVAPLRRKGDRPALREEPAAGARVVTS